jgi:hypothetical protein
MVATKDTKITKERCTWRLNRAGKWISSLCFFVSFVAKRFVFVVAGRLRSETQTNIVRP